MWPSSLQMVWAFLFCQARMQLRPREIRCRRGAREPGDGCFCGARGARGSTLELWGQRRPKPMRIVRSANSTRELLCRSVRASKSLQKIISLKTVETHRAAVMHKLKLRTTAELVLYAVRNHIVQP